MAQEKKHYKGYSISKRGNSFFIRITYKGNTYRYTYHPPEGLTESKQYAAAEKEAIRLRDKVQLGYSTAIPTFRTYAESVIESKKELRLRNSTINQYKYLMPRLLDEFGDEQLDHITPQRLNKFYKKLSNSNTMVPASALAIPGLLGR